MGLEQMNLNWSAEIIRVLNRGGVFCGRIETHGCLDVIVTLPEPHDCGND